MHSGTDLRLRAGVLALLIAAANPASAALHQAGSQGERPSRPEVTSALERVKADPNLATERTITTLRWKDSTEKTRSNTPAWFAWVAGLFGWIAQSSRILVWFGFLVLVGTLVVFLVRWVRVHGVPRREEPFIAPTHVRDLDIRPETLPDDIGAAARAMWDRGEHRAALALLYRGLLSRLAHVYMVPIRDSSTEGDCLELAANHLTPRRRDYASRVVRVWQRAVYGRQDVQAATVYLLCDDFRAALDRGSSPDPVAPGGRA